MISSRLTFWPSLMRNSSRLLPPEGSPATTAVPAGASLWPREIRAGVAGFAVSWALLVCRLGAIHNTRAAMTAATATPVAPHVNFFARAIYHSTKNRIGALGGASERRRCQQIASGNTDDREGAVNRGQDLVVFVKRCIGDIDNVLRLNSELLGDKDRYWLKQVQPKNARPGRGIVAQIPHSEHINASFVCSLILQPADIPQCLQ